MSKRSKRILGSILASTFLIVAFQNCAESQFMQPNGVTFKSSSIDPELGVTPTGQTPGGNNPFFPMPTPGGNNQTQNPEGVPPERLPSRTQTLESGEVACDVEEMTESLVYPLQMSANATAQSFGMLSSNEISAEWISKIGSIAKSNLKVTAHTIDKISSMAIGSLKINARLVKSAGSMAFSRTRIIADELQEMSSFAGRVCVGAHKVGSIGQNAGAVTVVGRAENGQRATVQSIGRMGGFISLYNVDIDLVSNLATRAKFENVHLKTLRNGAGQIILVDSKIDSIDHFAGTIILRGNSSVGDVSAQSAVRLVHE